MPSYSVSASEIKYASGSSWTSGKARQGVYSSTRYEGALNFAGLANFSFSNIAITGIQMRVTFGPTGGSSTKYLTLYGGAKNSISGSIASMRGSALGAVSVRRLSASSRSASSPKGVSGGISRQGASHGTTAGSIRHSAGRCFSSVS